MTDASAAAAPNLDPSRPTYDGRLGELYGIYLRHLALMVLTLGWSRFWGRTRLRRYLWSHLAVLGDRFEYRGRGIELMVGFVLVLLMLGLWAGVIWLVRQSEPLAGVGFLNLYSISLLFIGFPLALVGQFAGLRYKLTRTRWRGIRCGLDGSAWAYGVRATVLTMVNAFSGQLLLPVVSVALAKPRLGNLRLGTQGFEFAGRAGDIYGRYLGYYFLNILAWMVAFGVGAVIVGTGFEGLDLKEQDFTTLFSKPTLQTVALALLFAFGVYLLFGLLILPVRCWWQAYLFRYLVSRTRAGNVLFASALSTRQMWGFMVLNYLIVVLTLGLGWPWVTHRTMRLVAGELWIYGVPDAAAIRQPPNSGPGYGEGLLDMFDVTGV